MKIRLNKAHYPVTVLGHGRRIGIWMQGCSIGCPHCISRDTWETTGGSEMEVADLLAWCRRVATMGVDGVTISGGEPFEQPVALAELLDGLDAWRRDAGLEIDLLCYSGLPRRTLEARHADLLARLDAVIPEPYVHTLGGAPLRGSANQELLPLSPLGELRYADGAPALAQGQRMQMQVDGERIWLIGIPAPGDMARIEAACAARGLQLENASWHG